MPFFSAPLIQSATPTLGAVNLYANHVAKTSSIVDVVLKQELGMAADEDTHTFVRVAVEAENAAGKDGGCEDACNDNTATPTGAASSSTAEEAAPIPAASAKLLVTIAGVVTPKGGALVYTPMANSGAQQEPTVLTAPLPSGEPIAAVMRLPAVGSSSSVAVGEKAPRDNDSPTHAFNYVVADAVGNVYLLKDVFGAAEGTAFAPARKAARAEGSGATTTTSASTVAAPILIATAGAHEPMVGAFPAFSMGAGGWVGIDRLPYTGKAGEVVIAVGREGARDVRIIRFGMEELKGSVLASFYPHHAPTSMAVVSAGGDDAAKKLGWSTLVAVANGPLVAFYDASLSMKTSTAGTVAVASATRAPHHVITTRSIVWSITSAASVSGISAISSVAAPYFVWAASADRSLTLYDASRAFMRVHAAPNVLKYDALTAAIASIDGADAATNSGATADKNGILPLQVAVSGVDCEVRAIGNINVAPLGTTNAAATKEKDKAAAAANKAKGGNDATKQPPSASSPEEEPAAVVVAASTTPAGAPDTHNPNSFRGRLNSAVHGDDVWVGRWSSFSVVGADGTTATIAAGLSRIGTLFVVA